MDIKQLNDKYRVAAPRYTSYPTVPYWDSCNFTELRWSKQVLQSNDFATGISLYIHLPFCESLCTYCGCNTRITKNHSVEGPYISAVLKEWQLYLRQFSTKPLIKEIHLGGGTPTFFRPANLELLITGITEYAYIHPEAEFSIEAHPNNTTTEHLEVLYRLGFRRLSLGIQDFDPTVQFVINRIQSVKSVADVTAEARRIGYHSVNYDLIYGLPLQKLEGLISTIDIVTELAPDRIAFYSYAHVPWVRPGQRRYTEAHLPSAELKAELYQTGRKMLIDARYTEIGMDHFTVATDSLYQAHLSGRLRRNFMGYTEQSSRVLIGLGVSAISDCWTAFAQNVKTVEEYLKIVNEGRIPVFKGHLLNQSDLVIRQHILNIMCKGFTSWIQPEMQDKIFSEAKLRLLELADDGLIVLGQSELKVTTIGKRFLRNICMAIDARLWDFKPETQLFSIAD
ncbi:oxygen-independent coproporphyrinogen III oxidase [Pedobacter nutrimenti]|uniref:Coproporphyrinogen-III oxidase n=1 Tax=Pedobacter nutrimenti TaxID=1241337 RepID=A0A318U8I4_9SPHI|nr:oxygen-independent coproporphyrinogen III oxidase [Pedobacter nutrimenti]PYF70590.1 oxygen-independent coproporphyrinogen-3 oxidase [Pedobacter nutrimenti]